MSNAEFKSVPKADIKPVKLVVTLEATKVNTHGTFSGFNVVSVEGPNKNCGATAPNYRQPHLLRFYTNSQSGIEVLSKDAPVAKSAKKVFDIEF